MSNPLRLPLNSSKISSFSLSPLSPFSLIFPKSGDPHLNQTPSSRIYSVNVLGPVQFIRLKRLASFKVHFFFSFSKFECNRDYPFVNLLFFSNAVMGLISSEVVCSVFLDLGVMVITHF